MFNKIVSLALSVASRGIKNTKIDLETKKLRYISCFGFSEISPCSKLKKSKKSDFYYCGGCGCGDHSHTYLIKNPGEYSKLDYPVLNCPLNMPGFSNYDPNSPNTDLERKKLIENFDFEKFKFIDITISIDKEKEEILEQVNKIIKNS
jgi:hypothetical protein